MSEIEHDYFNSPHAHYPNDRQQAALMIGLLAVAAIGSVLMILWALLV